MNAEAGESTDVQGIPPSEEPENEQERKSVEALLHCHLDWSDQQRRILTANGTAEEYYRSERGFAFEASELPHHYLQLGTTHEVFRHMKDHDNQRHNPIVGAWKRTLFWSNGRSGWEFSTHHTERVFNVQTRTLFVDLRIPHTRDQLLAQSRSPGRIIRSLEDLTAEELRWYARQHVFAGFSRFDPQSATGQEGVASGTSPANLPLGTSALASMSGCCTRHHCIDWNFVGSPRSRPNKWWVETPSESSHTVGSPPLMWREWAYALSDHGQFYYGEQWENLELSGSDRDLPAVVAMRLRPCEHHPDRDGLLVCVGDHFNFCRQLSPRSVQDQESTQYEDCRSQVEVVDKAIHSRDWTTARRFLSLQGGHGRLSDDWKIDCSIEFWREGLPFWSPSEIVVQGASVPSCTLNYQDECWEVFECSLLSLESLKKYLRIP